MWGNGLPLHEQKIVSLIQLGLPDCTLVSSQCGGQVSCHSLLLALHSPLLAGLLLEARGMRKEAGHLGQLGQGEVGLTLPLPLKTIKGLVAILQGEAEEVKEEVKETVDFLGMGEYVTENIINSKEDTKCAKKSLDNSEDVGEYNILEKVREANSDLSMGLQEGCDSLVRGATLEEELPSKWEDGQETTHTSIEHEQFESRDESSLLEKEKVACNSKKYSGSLLIEDKKHKQTTYVKAGKEEKPFPNGSQASQNEVICVVCSKTFTNKYYLKKHVTNIHEKHERYAPCSHCLKQVSILFISNHQNKCRMSNVRDKYDNELQRSICDSCGKTFMNKTKLKRHIKDNHEGRPKYKPERTLCNICYKSFNNKQYLEKHMIFVHANTVIKFVCCSLCEKQFSIISIANHERMCKMSDKEREEYKDKQKAFCQECGQTLSSKVKLRRHIANIHQHGKISIPL